MKSRYVAILIIIYVAFGFAAFMSLGDLEAQAPAQLPMQVETVMNLRGLNTLDDQHSATPGQARILNNVDLQRRRGDWTKRWGFDSACTFPSDETTLYATYPEVDSLIGICGAPYKDGSRQLFVVAVLADSGYAGVWCTQLNSIDMDSLDRICNYFCATSYPEFEMYDDMVIISSPTHDAIIYDHHSSVVRRFPIEAPGAPRAMPLTLSGNVNDEHYYILRASYYGTVGGTDDTTVTVKNSVVAGPATVRGGKVMLYNFDYPAPDTLLTQIDSVTYAIWRTGGASWTHDSVEYVGATTYLSLTGAEGNCTAYRSYTFTDNDSEGDADPALFTDPIKIEPYRWGADSVMTAKDNLTRLVGHLAYVAGDSSEADSGIWAGWGFSDTLAYVYRYSIVDNQTGVESNLSPPFYYFHRINTDDVEFLIPETPFNDCIVNLYRAQFVMATHDTTVMDELTITEEVRGGYYTCGDYGVIDPSRYEAWYDGDPDDCIFHEGTTVYDTTWGVNRILIDSLYVLPYRLVTQVDGDSTQAVTVIDSVSQTALELNVFAHPQYASPQLPMGLHGFTTFERRLWAFAKSALYWSNVNDAFVWSGNNRTPINENDGDAITTIYATRQTLQIKKNSAGHQLYAGLDDLSYSDWSRTEIGQHIGCVAPRSHLSTPMGNYFISENGVHLETEGTTLERNYVYRPVDKDINNIRGLDPSVRNDIYAVYWKQRCIFNAGDTAYVWDEVEQGWTTWTGLDIRSATHFGIPTGSDVRADTLYFVNGTSLEVGRYGVSEYDDGTNVKMTIQMAPLEADNTYKQLMRLGLWLDYDAVMNDTIFADVKDEDGNTEFSSDLQYVINARYREQEPAGHNALYFQPYFECGGTLDDTTYSDRYAITAVTYSFKTVEVVTPTVTQ